MHVFSSGRKYLAHSTRVPSLACEPAKFAAERGISQLLPAYFPPPFSSFALRAAKELRAVTKSPILGRRY
jgi:hypothetical protein